MNHAKHQYKGLKGGNLLHSVQSAPDWRKESLRLVSQIAELVEAKLPANPHSPQNQKHSKKLEAIFKAYFTALENKLPRGEVKVSHVRSANSATRKTVLSQYKNAVIDAYIDGANQMNKWAKGKGLKVLEAEYQPYEGPAPKQAYLYAEAHCGKMITAIEETTQQRIANIIAANIKQKGGIPGMQRDIKNRFDFWRMGDQMSISRARIIARTESADALTQSAMDRALMYEISYMEWVTFDPCEICSQNSGKVRKIGLAFPSGDERPPVHPSCRCALAPSLSPYRAKQLGQRK